jgi:hypothetical protein
MQVGPACDTQAGHVVRGRGREASRSRGRVSCPLRRVSGVVSRCRRLSQRQPETETHSPPCAPGFIPTTSHTPFLSPPSLPSPHPLSLNLTSREPPTLAEPAPTRTRGAGVAGRASARTSGVRSGPRAVRSGVLLRRRCCSGGSGPGVRAIRGNSRELRGHLLR